MSISCVSPLYRVPIGSPNWYRLTSFDQSKLRNHGVFLSFAALQAYEDVPGFVMDDVQIIGCGQCAACRLKKSREWAIRCALEAECHEFNYFVTLTYDYFSIPSGEFIDYKGDIYDSNLSRRDVQLFIKNFREWERTENNNIGVKVFYCGEYGDQKGRPHYHLCIFGCSQIPDLEWSFRRGSYDFYKSKTFESFWSYKVGSFKSLKGFVDISEVTFDSAAYTARYVMKKQQGVMKKDFLEYYDGLEDPPELRLQPFVGMSLKPGIAAEYYEKHKFTIREEDLVKYHKKYELFNAKPPRYFDRLFDREDHEGYLKVAFMRKRSGIASRKLKGSITLESYISRLEREGGILERKLRRYVRPLG